MPDHDFRQLSLRQEDTRIQLAQLQASFDRQRPMFDATIKFAEIGIRSLLLLNGGAVIALLTFMGHKIRPDSVSLLAVACGVFALGAALSVLTSLLAYVSQGHYVNGALETKGDFWRLMSLLAGIGSISLFLLGLGISMIALLEAKEANAGPSMLEPFAWPFIALVALVLAFASFLIHRRYPHSSSANVSVGGSLTQGTDDELVRRPTLTNDADLQPWITEVDTVVATNGWTPSELPSRLHTLAATLMRRFQFEYLRREIFGTQVAALRTLAASEGLTSADLSTIHEQHVRRVQEAEVDTHLDFVSWLGFLTTFKLIFLDDNHYRLSSRGLQFLIFAGHHGVSEDKLY